jgi:UDP-N-acetylglucosamine--N-acetylmuramyl-(pentapeptide) pyrophosphoryl-undecaprenol N-acetylglucosamine transferase
LRATILITGGGTGGHVYPALSIIPYLRQPRPSQVRPAGAVPESAAPRGASNNRRTPTDSGIAAVDEAGPIYIGNSRGMERNLVPGSGIPCFLLPMSASRSPRGIFVLALAFIRSLIILLRTRPRATLATGGYVSAPVGLASWLLRVPLVLFLPDLVPGKSGAWLAPFARRIAVATEDSLPYLPAQKTVVTGYPVRAPFFEASRDAGRRLFGIPPDARVLCVFGGSQGSRSINAAVAAALPYLLQKYLVLHISGPDRYPEAQAAAEGLSPEIGGRYQLFPYLDAFKMAEALAAADLAICRSGASVLGEIAATGTPAILVPLPERGVHQYENAEFLARAGAAMVVNDDELAQQLTELVDLLLGNPNRLSDMADACRRLARPDAARDIADLVWEAAG